MGAYKRNKTKVKPKQRFVNTEMVLAYLHKNMSHFEKFPETILQIERREIEFGDEWSGESGYEYLIFFSDKSGYLVGRTMVHEDAEDWAQAERWEQFHCSNYYDGYTVDAIEVMLKLEKLTEEYLRDVKIELLLD